jgi:hypothetical protein
MMGVTGKSSLAEEAGVFGLMAFLADSKKSAERLGELRAMSDVAEAADIAARNAKLEAEAAQKQAGEAQAAALVEQKKASERMEQAEVVVREARSAEGKVVVHNKELADALTALMEREEHITAKEVEIARRVQGVADTEAVVLGLKAEYEEKLSKLRTIAGS